MNEAINRFNQDVGCWEEQQIWLHAGCMLSVRRTLHYGRSPCADRTSTVPAVNIDAKDMRTLFFTHRHITDIRQSVHRTVNRSKRTILKP